MVSPPGYAVFFLPFPSFQMSFVIRSSADTPSALASKNAASNVMLQAVRSIFPM